MMGFLLTGALLGLSGGLSPGPLLALVISETLRHGMRAGMGVALAPLLTDVPIILGTVMLLQPLADRSLPLALIHLGGGFYLGWLGVQGMGFRGAELQATDPAGSLRRGVIANFLNPSPYLFWLAIGAPTVLNAWQQGGPAVATFLLAFYTLLVGSKILLAIGVGRFSQRLLRSRGYIVLMRGLGLILLVYGLWLLRDGGRLLYTLLPL